MGDYTETLSQALQVGDPVKVEGPYGRFNFSGRQSRQIWVAGGIGITPFIARMQALQKQPGAHNIDLFYSTSAPDDEFLARLRQLTERSQVRLHVLVSGKDPRLTADRLCQLPPPNGGRPMYGSAVRPVLLRPCVMDGLLARGLPAEDFHQELFDMR